MTNIISIEFIYLALTLVNLGKKYMLNIMLDQSPGKRKISANVKILSWKRYNTFRSNAVATPHQTRTMISS